VIKLVLNNIYIDIQHLITTLLPQNMFARILLLMDFRNIGVHFKTSRFR